MLAFSALTVSAANKLTATPSIKDDMEIYESNLNNLVDGNPSTILWTKIQEEGQYILLTLDGDHQIGTINLVFSQDGNDKPASSKIQYSTDNSQWYDVPNGTVSTSGSSFSCNAGGAHAQYVRLYLTGSNTNWLKIAEFEVYEADATKTLSPVFNPESKAFNEGESGEITITSSDADAVIYYTTDGTEPTTSSASISNGGTVTVPTDDWTKSTTVKAIAKTESKDASNVVSATYTVVSPYCQPNVSTNGSGAKYVGQIVTLTTTGAEVNADWTNPRTENYNGYVGVIANTFTAKAGQTNCYAQYSK